MSYYHYDLQGNVRYITDGDGDVIEESKYRPFGERFDSDMTDVHGFTGKELDKSDNYYFNARYQSPELGRFNTPDTFKPSLLDPQSLNLYTYTLNNPLKYIDPTGNQFEPSIMPTNQNQFDQYVKEEYQYFQEKIVPIYKMAGLSQEKIDSMLIIFVFIKPVDFIKII